MAKYKKGDVIIVNLVTTKHEKNAGSAKLKVVTIGNNNYGLEILTNTNIQNCTKGEIFLQSIKEIDSSSVLLESTQPVKVIERRINVNFHNDTWIDKLYNSYCTWKGRFLEKDKKEIIIEEKIIENE